MNGGILLYQEKIRLLEEALERIFYEAGWDGAWASMIAGEALRKAEEIKVVVPNEL